MDGNLSTGQVVNYPQELWIKFGVEKPRQQDPDECHSERSRSLYQEIATPLRGSQ